MVDANGKKIKVGQLVLIKSKLLKKEQYFYIKLIDNPSSGLMYGKRVNRDFSFNKFDKNKYSGVYIQAVERIEIIDPLPEEFKESLRTLNFFVDEILDEFGVLINHAWWVMFRAVRYENGSYGIVQSKLYDDCNCIDTSYETSKIFTDLTYNELINQWERKKNAQNTEWRESF